MASSDARASHSFARIASTVTKAPRRVVVVWLLLAALLALFGLGVDGKLASRPLFADGTSAQREHELVLREFGGENALIVLLRGPRADVERQGRLLERRLDALPDTLVMSPWDSGGSIEGLMPSPGVAAIVVNVKSAGDEDVTKSIEPVRAEVDRSVALPVHASVAGAPAIGDAFMQATKRAALMGERIAIPLLLIILLLVFRSVIAAAIPIVIGGAVVAATRGVLDLLLGVVEIDAFALGAVGMMGLALGVDYSLLVVSRYREEIARGVDPVQAVGRTIEFTGPTVATAGAGLALAMVAASQLLPGGIIMSVSIAVVTASILSVASAVLVVPAILLLLGPRLDQWAWPRRTGDRGRTLRLTEGLSRRPRAVVLPVVLALLAMALWAFSLDTGIGSVALLPANDPGRRQQEDVQRALGPGWIAPYEIVMQSGDEPVTTPGRLHQLASFQRRVEDDPGVASMTGFAGIERATRRLGGLGRELADQQKGLKRLGDGLGRVHAGAVLNTNGLIQAADGARRLDTGVLAAGSGAGQLAEGLKAASTGSTRLSGGLDRANEGSSSLATGAVKASSGAHRLSDGLSRAQERTGEMASSARVLENAMDLGDSRLAELESTVATTESQLAASLAALRAMTSGRTDPQYGTALEAAEAATASLTGTDPASGDPSADAQGVNAGIGGARGQFSLGSYLSRRLRKNGRQASDGIAKLARGSSRLDSGLAKLADGSRQVSVGIDRLSQGGRALAPGIQRLSSGAGQLASGLGQLRTGTTALAGGLGGGAQKSKLLAGALHKIGSGVERQADEGSASGSPPQGMFRSGYFYLASIDGSSAERRGRAGFLISLDRGGHAARMLVIPRHTPSEPEAAETLARIERDADRLARRTGTTVVVGGATPAQLEIDDAFRDQAPLARLILALVTVIILVPLLRSLIVPVIAALLNVLTVAATFGLLALFFDDSFLGGPGYIDTTVIPATIMVIFGLAIDYEVFIFSRMREEYLRTGSAEAAIVEGLDRTAPVVTGAAVIMIAVFLAFATSSFSTIRGFGVAQAVAVAIDAFAIRLVVIPAVMRALGSRAWWMPRWLDRLLPGGGASPAAAEGGAR